MKAFGTIICLLLILGLSETPIKAQTNFSDLVVNEILASNDSFGFDQDGQYNDWVEILNTGDSTIQLSGFYLTDNSSNLTKWMIPDTSIAAKAYLIIWCDRDSHQTGLHAGFKLSAAGEECWLVDPDTNVVDGLVYDSVGTDVAIGRCPNGTGPYTNLIPTHAAANDCGIFVDQSQATRRIEIFPIPANKQITIRSNSAELFDVRIYNANGQILFEELNQSASTTVDVRNWPRGIYFLRSPGARSGKVVLY